MLTRKTAGVKAVDVERLNARLVGARRADRCLTEKSNSFNIWLHLTRLDGHVLIGETSCEELRSTELRRLQ